MAKTAGALVYSTLSSKLFEFETGFRSLWLGFFATLAGSLLAESLVPHV